jgi:hypothetical protein
MKTWEGGRERERDAATNLPSHVRNLFLDRSQVGRIVLGRRQLLRIFARILDSIFANKSLPSEESDDNENETMETGDYSPRQAPKPE